MDGMRVDERGWMSERRVQLRRGAVQWQLQRCEARTVGRWVGGGAERASLRLLRAGCVLLQLCSTRA